MGPQPQVDGVFKCGPLHMAVQGAGNVEVVDLLLAAGACPDQRDASLRTPLMRAAARGLPQAVRALLRWGAAAGAQDIAGDTAAHHLARGFRRHKAERYVAALEALLAYDADPWAANAAGETPRTIAARLGAKELLRLISAEMVARARGYKDSPQQQGQERGGSQGEPCSAAAVAWILLRCATQ